MLPAKPDFQTVLERTGTDELNAAMIQYQIWDVAQQCSLLPPGAFNNGKRGGSSRRRQRTGGRDLSGRIGFGTQRQGFLSQLPIQVT